MAKKAGGKVVKTVTETVETGAPGDDELEIPAGSVVLDEGPDADELDGMAKLRELAGGNTAAMYEVRRVLPSAERGYCGTLSHDEMCMERVQEEWGAGTYTIRVRLAQGHFAGSARVEIAPLPKHKQNAAPVVSAPAQDSNLMAMLGAMQAASKSQIDMLTGLVTSLIQKPAPEPVKQPDMLQLLAAAKELVAPPERESKSDPMEMFLKGLTMGKELGGDGHETGMADIAMRGLDAIKDMASKAPPPPARPAITTMAVPAIGPASAPAPLTTAAPVVQPGAPPMLKMLQWLNQQTKMLVYQASKGKNPELYAELFLDNLPEFLGEEEILERMKAPDAIEKLAKLDANVLAFRPWFEKFRATCVELLTEDAAQEEAQEFAPGPGGENFVPGDLTPDVDGGSDGEG